MNQISLALLDNLAWSTYYRPVLSQVKSINEDWTFTGPKDQVGKIATETAMEDNDVPCGGKEN